MSQEIVAQPRADLTVREGTEGTYRHKGLAWLDAAKCLHQNNREGFGAFYYLVSHACELFTKAFLIWRGVPYDQLKSRELGHDIQRLVEKAQELGLPIEEEFKPFFEALENLNQENMQKYPKLGFFTLGQQGYVEPHNMLSWADIYYKKIYAIISKEKNAKNK